MKSLSTVFASFLLCIPLISIGQQQQLFASIDQAKSPSWEISVGTIQSSSEAVVSGYSSQLSTFFEKHLIYPELAFTHGMEGTVLVRMDFIQGKLQQLSLVQKAGFGMDIEALRVAQLLYNYPTNEIMSPTASLYIPISFTLHASTKLTN